MSRDRTRDERHYAPHHIDSPCTTLTDWFDTTYGEVASAIRAPWSPAVVWANRQAALAGYFGQRIGFVAHSRGGDATDWNCSGPPLTVKYTLMKLALSELQ